MKELNVIVVEKLSPKQKQAIFDLQKQTFTEIDTKEAEEDFYCPKSAQVLAYVGKEIVGWAGIYETKQIFEGKSIKFGGYGICTHPDWQGKGVASKVSRSALTFLKNKDCEVGFLSVEPSNTASVKLHQKNGFVLLPRNFSWKNSKGKVKQDKGGMISPINSQELFEYVLNGKEPLHIGNGYW